MCSAITRTWAESKAAFLNRLHHKQQLWLGFGGSVEETCGNSANGHHVVVGLSIHRSSGLVADVAGTLDLVVELFLTSNTHPKRPLLVVQQRQKRRSSFRVSGPHVPVMNEYMHEAH
jgi:hypothetical protein